MILRCAAPHLLNGDAQPGPKRIEESKRRHYSRFSLFIKLICRYCGHIKRHNFGNSKSDRIELPRSKLEMARCGGLLLSSLRTKDDKSTLKPFVLRRLKVLPTMEFVVAAFAVRTSRVKSHSCSRLHHMPRAPDQTTFVTSNFQLFPSLICLNSFNLVLLLRV
jgi:hypothetical protein